MGRPSKYSKILTKQFLIKEYIKNKNSTYKIAKEFNYGRASILRYLHKFNIRIRNRIGENCPFFKDGRTLKTYNCNICQKKIDNDTALYGTGLCSSCAHKLKIGKLATNWQGGKSFEPYPIEWTNILKKSIRIRDNHTCQLCNKSAKQNGRKLDIHHIDYDKMNIKPDNLISLCQSCHTQTNGNRDIYIEYFKILRNLIYN